MTDDKKEAEELIGVASQTSALALSDLRETDIDRVAAFGMALRRSAGSVTVFDTRAVARRVDAELARALWRAAYGADQNCVSMAEGALELTLTLRMHTARLKPLAAEPFRARALVKRVVHEWIHDRCPECAGSGSQEISGGRRVRPRRHGIRNAKMAVCIACDGSGRAKPKRHERRRSIEREGEGMDQHTFDRLWSPVFQFAAYQCDRVAGNLRRPTMRALRGKPLTKVPPRG
jgi:hypothetical protein